MPSSFKIKTFFDTEQNFVKLLEHFWHFCCSVCVFYGSYFSCQSLKAVR